MNAVDKSIEQYHLDNALAQLDDASQDFIEGLHHELVQLREQEEETERMIRVLGKRCAGYKNEVERLQANMQTAKKYIEIDGLIDDIENFYGEDSDELAEVISMWELAHENLNEAKRYAEQVLPKQLREQGDE